MAQFFGLIPLNADNFESGSASEGQVLSADGEGGASWAAASGSGLSYKVYTAILTQSGVNAPTAEVIENTFDDTPTFEYVDTGIYSISSTEFSEGMTCFGIATNFTLSDYNDEVPRIVLLQIINSDGEVLISSQDLVTYEYVNDFIGVNIELRIYD